MGPASRNRSPLRKSASQGLDTVILTGSPACDVDRFEHRQEGEALQQPVNAPRSRSLSEYSA